MILKRLYELALREGLLDDVAFEEQPVPFIIKVDDVGSYLGIEERRGEIELKGKKGATRKVPDKGKLLSVPRAHGNTASQGFARFFVDTLPRVLPTIDDAKSKRSRETFWRQIRQATEETRDSALRAVMTFGGQVVEDAELATRIRKDVEKLKPGPSDRCAFAWEPDRGQTILEREAVRSWYRKFFEAVAASKQEAGPTGLCQVSGKVGPIPTTHSIPLVGVPDGLPTGVKIVSYDKAAFESYGLDGTANAGVGYSAADGYARAVNALIGNKLKGNPRTSLRIGSDLFLFWTREPADSSDIMALDSAEPAQVERLLLSAKRGAQEYSVDTNDFYLLCLSGNAARAIVRDYLEAKVPVVQANLGCWFRDLTIAAATKDEMGGVFYRFPLWQLVAATAAEMDRVAPELPARLVRAALKGDALPDSVLAACVSRLRAEGSSGFRVPRMALIKLTLMRKGISVSETLDPEGLPPYVCGRLLEVFEQIQYAALGDVNATVTDKFFGTFSAAPAVVLGRLYHNAQNHLRKLRADKHGAYVVLDKLLADVTNQLKASALPTGHLSLREQGLFALGYYHQKAKHFAEIAERRKAKADAQAE
jgi:CRISPR-associated protein Csd1